MYSNLTFNMVFLIIILQIYSKLLLRLRINTIENFRLMGKINNIL